MNTHKYKNQIILVSFILTGIILLLMIGGTAPQLCKDSDMYYNSQLTIGIMPLYPLFLKLCLFIAGPSRQLLLAALVQILLSAVCIAFFIDYIRKQFHLPHIVSYICLLFAYLPYIICTPELKIAQAVMTEALTFPFFYLYMIFALDCILHGHKASAWISFFLSCILALTRSQLQLIILISAMCLFYSSCKKRNFRNNRISSNIGYTAVQAVLCAGAILISLCFVSFCNKTYEKVVFQSTSGAQSSNALLGRVMYQSELSDEALFSDPDEKEVYQSLYEAIDEKGYRTVYSREGLWRWEDISESSNEIAKIGVDVAEDYGKQQLGITDSTILNQFRSDVLGSIGTVLLKEHWKDYITDTLYLLPQGFIATVLFQKDAFYGLCHIATLCLYLGAFLFMYLSFMRKDTNKSLIEFMLLVIIIAVLNVLATNIIFYSVQRYLVYTYGMFYIAGLLLFIDLCKNWKRKL